MLGVIFLKSSKKWLFFLITIIAIICGAFAVYKVRAGNENEQKTVKDKAQSELKFLEGKIVKLFNSMNGIEFENYKISVTEVQGEASNASTAGRTEWWFKQESGRR